MTATSDAAILHGVVIYIMRRGGEWNLARWGCMVSYIEEIHEEGGGCTLSMQ
jgi:hypothetical protein